MTELTKAKINEIGKTLERVKAMRHVLTDPNDIAMCDAAIEESEWVLEWRKEFDAAEAEKDLLKLCVLRAAWNKRFGIEE